MVTFILPGGSAKNKIWLEDTANNLNLSHEVRPVYWSHWDDPDAKFDPKEKVRLIVDVAMQNSINIVAKSIGTLVASMIMAQVPEKIQKVVFNGIPLNDLNEGDLEVYRSSLRNFPAEKIEVFQNDDDPHANYDQVKDFLMKINPEIKVIQKDRNDHDYPYFEEFREFLLREPSDF